MADVERANPTFVEVPWLRIFPWLRLARVPGGAGDPKRLMLAAAGLLLMHLGWAGLDRLFPGSADVTPAATLSGEPRAWASPIDPTRLAEPLQTLATPFRALFDPKADGASSTHAFLAVLWATAVWGIFGGAIARSSAVALAKGERILMRDGLRFAVRHAAPLVATPIVPLLGVGLVTLPVAVFGLLYRSPGVGTSVAGWLAVLPLIGGMLMALTLIGLAAGWPLMIGSVAAEADDGFDALSRAYAFVHQRPWHYLGYAAFAGLVGWAGLAFVTLFAELVVSLTAWALGFGGTGPVVNPYFGVAPPPNAGIGPHGVWLAAVKLLVHAWTYSYLWSAAAGIYLLLRRDVDGTPFHSIVHKSV